MALKNTDRIFGTYTYTEQGTFITAQPELRYNKGFNVLLI